ncbi:deoxyribodipyrimidine photo-lyase [Oceanobacter mangrovi]|uniref:deoxyribodipyrimidine photo-lyase n=1 Tax=Oceanobacter mangrovi TaxID=2862510 RepID=UPI001C8D82CD|nr:deoxyribodipyrimidine photo-lyase [Oceanobacter mangrovi]
MSSSDSQRTHNQRTLVWLRTDLRSRDNPALWHACQQPGEVVAVYCHTQAQWQQHGLGPRKIRLMENAVAELQQQLAQRNIPLLVLQADDFSNSLTLLQQLITELQIQRVYFNNEYEVNERKRDINFCRWAKQQQLEVLRYHDQCLVPPGEVLTKTAQPFKVYSPFRRAWLPLAERLLEAPLAQPASSNQVSANPAAELSAELQQRLLSLSIEADPLWAHDEDSLHQQLERFIDERAEDYKEQRDLPAVAGTSQLSTALSIGLLSVRQCIYAAAQANNGLLAGGKRGLDSWVNELTWRDFYRHLLVAFPALCKHQNFKPDYNGVRWRDSDSDFAAWCEGRTGYPIVDAAQRQLLQTGWMHNRLRMISAMFLTKHLLIDWRRGEAFFNQQLVDADLASNNGGWQWSASTGADGAPYFRIFNPISQSEKFDADGEFIARYVPELARLPGRSRHQPNAFERQQCGYPQPVVEQSFGRQRALEAFRELKESAPEQLAGASQ